MLPFLIFSCRIAGGRLHPQLQQLIIRDNETSLGISSLPALLQAGACPRPQIQKLNICNNSAGGEGIVPLVAALQAGACLQLQHLDIRGNCAGERLSPLSTALQAGACPQLRHLSIRISGNNAGGKGLPMFLAALAKATGALACPLLCEMYIR